MSFKALFLANAVMLLFLGFALVQSYNSMNTGNLLADMRTSGLIQPVSPH